MATKKPKKVKLKFYLKNWDDRYSYWQLSQLEALKFQDLCELTLANKIELFAVIMQDALNQEDLKIKNIPVAQELEKSISLIYVQFPAIKYFVEQRQKMMKSNYIQA